MAFVQRKRKNDSEKVDEKVSKTEQYPKKHTFKINLKTYKEEAIETLNLLEKRGINIYDTTRYAGMYLKTNTNKIRKIDKIFEQEENKNIQRVDYEKIFN